MIRKMIFNTSLFLAICLLIDGLMGGIGKVEAATLGDLPLGSVIQIQGTDTFMCSNSNCSTTTATILPYKFVKMQARDPSGVALGNASGNCVSGNCNGYTYCALLDNYCWWGSAQCKYNGTLSSSQNGWNGVSGTSPPNSGATYSNNITETRADNILKQLNNFYNSLPTHIDGVSKSTVIPNYAWDLIPMSQNNPSAAFWGSTSGSWSTTANANVPSGITFSGDNSNPIVNSRIGLLSFTDWQGGTSVYSTFPSLAGSGYSYCQARFGVDCSNNSNYGLFNDASAIPVLGTAVASASNPRPRYPWLRSPWPVSGVAVWAVRSSNATYSVNNYVAYDYYGVSPSLWLSSSIATNGTVAGTYANPYVITTMNDTIAPTVSGTNAATTWYNTDRTSTVTATDTGGSGVAEIRYAFGATSPLNSACTSGGTVITSGSTTTAAPAGGTTLWLCVRDIAGNVGTNSGAFNVDKTAPTVSGTNAATTWYNTDRTSTVTATDTGGSGVAEIRYAFGATNPLNSACTSGGTVITSGSTTTVALTDGTTLWLCVRDNVGNVGTNSGVFNVDKTPPVVNATGDSSSLLTELPYITVLAIDTLSGINEVRYVWDTNNLGANCSTGGTITSNGADLSNTLTTGNHTLYLCARDLAGNYQFWSGVYKYISHFGDLSLTVMKNKPFQMYLGTVGGFLLSPGTQGGVTVSVDPLTNQATASGTLSSNTSLPFGKVNLDFTVINSPYNQVSNISWH